MIKLKTVGEPELYGALASGRHYVAGTFSPGLRESNMSIADLLEAGANGAQAFWPA
jgi:hypothetical protein